MAIVIDASVVLALLLDEKNATKADAQALIEAFAQLPIAFDGQAVATGALYELALNAELTSCDASYLILAQRLHAPMASFDERLVAAAEALNIPVLS